MENNTRALPLLYVIASEALAEFMKTYSENDIKCKNPPPQQKKRGGGKENKIKQHRAKQIGNDKDL